MSWLVSDLSGGVSVESRGPQVGVSDDDDDDLAGVARQRRGGLQALGTIVIVG
jgi:hypothetical protein